MDQQLGRRVPPDWEHVDKYPLTADVLAEITVPTPVVIGVNWYSNFDRPVKDSAGHWWIGKGSLGTVRGGHCVALKQRRASDVTGWWDFYNQGSEGACVGFGSSRAMSLLNRKRYDGFWLYHEAQKIDEWPGENYEGTSVRAGLNILKNKGHREVWGGVSKPVSLQEGISAYRWIRSMDDLMEVLGYKGLDYCDILNSWGRSYPHLTRIPLTTLKRLWDEDGEFGVITDR